MGEKRLIEYPFGHVLVLFWNALFGNLHMKLFERSGTIFLTWMNGNLVFLFPLLLLILGFVLFLGVSNGDSSKSPFWKGSCASLIWNDG